MLLSRVSDWRARSVDMMSLDNHSRPNPRSNARLNTNIRPSTSVVVVAVREPPLLNHCGIQLCLPLDRFLVDGAVLVSRLIHCGDLRHHVVQAFPDA